MPRLALDMEAFLAFLLLCARLLLLFAAVLLLGAMSWWLTPHPARSGGAKPLGTLWLSFLWALLYCSLLIWLIAWVVGRSSHHFFILF
jgi:hypothetical protein